MTNPLFAISSFPFFDQIEEEHFLPALEEAIDRAREKFIEIRDNSNEPTFENTVLPFDTLFSEIEQVFSILSLYESNRRTDNVLDIMERATEIYTELDSEIYQDGKMGDRFNVVYGQKSALDLDTEDEWFLEKIKRGFESTGALLNVAQQKRINEIDKALITATTALMKNIYKGADQQAFLVTDERQLAGVPDDVKSGLKENAENADKEGWLFIPERLLVDDLLGVAEDREFRRKMHEAMDRVGTQAPHDNTDLICEIHALRHERAVLLGYLNYAEASLAKTMAGSLPNVVDMFEETTMHLLNAFEEDMEQLQDFVDELGGPQLEPWDVQYYTTRYKQDRLGYDENALMPYLEIGNVMQGWIQHAEHHMNLGFIEVEDEYPVWDDDVIVYEVVDHDTGDTNVLYVDLYARPGVKQGGAWMSEIQKLNKDEGKQNIIIMNMNLVKAAEGKPTFISPGQIETLYHEGGHALNGLKGTDAKYQSATGTGNGSDYVEIHSMVSENWAFHPQVMATYAFHHETGAPLPEDLLRAKEEAGNFMASWTMLRLIQNATRDLAFHEKSKDEYQGINKIHEEAELDSDFSAHTRPYPLNRFEHMFFSGDSMYAAGYYGYYWAEVKALQAFEPFDNKGPYDPAELKKMQRFFAIGAGEEPNFAYEKRLGIQALDVTPFLAKYGVEIKDELLDQALDLDAREGPNV